MNVYSYGLFHTPVLLIIQEVLGVTVDYKAKWNSADSQPDIDGRYSAIEEKKRNGTAALLLRVF